MRIVVDSNVIVAAFGSRGLCYSIFELSLERCTIITSEFILREVENTLLNKFRIPPKAVNEIIEYLKEFCAVCRYNRLGKEVCRDKDDDEILALASDNKVAYIITGDKDLLVLKKYGSVEIVSPREFWSIVKSENLE
jgi:putative PIN family toxin of toxin-antitoxin system